MTMQYWARLDDSNRVAEPPIATPADWKPGVDFGHADVVYVKCLATTPVRALYYPSSGTFGGAQNDPLDIPLTEYVNRLCNAKLIAGIRVNVAAPGDIAVNILCDGTSTTIGDLNGQVAMLSATETTVWQDNLGVGITVTGAQLALLLRAVVAWKGRIYATSSQLLAQINAGDITSRAQIDAVVWPAS
jgi:hypothetical protein